MRYHLLFLLPVMPVSFVFSLTIKKKLAVPLSLIIFEVTSIRIPISPLKHPIAMLQVKQVMPRIALMLVSPHSIPASTALSEVSLVA